MFNWVIFMSSSIASIYTLNFLYAYANCFLVTLGELTSLFSQSMPGILYPHVLVHTLHLSFTAKLHGKEYLSSCCVMLTLKVLNFWRFTSYCSLKPLWSGMGEVVPGRTSPTLHPPSPPTGPSGVISEYVNPYIPTYTPEEYWSDHMQSITRLTAHVMCGLMSDLVICKFRRIWSYMTLNVLTETMCH